ncbi:PAS domain-containing protein [Mycolicibacterium komossense]|jgi:PAS domain S-box-containing protein|uniref:PAS domain-containing protein n=1 Tax=Mycolicibacterium komossense TaxID=1779 RepID=A0ABT3CKP1_9MYCO|nr:PAS domain-containing protein [Mycolicibacterium komossense]MCV7230076.1 PAS domain-containing protein [Mycolicibacterium komossense]
MEALQQLPALVVLERFPVPVLAITADGEILFANSAFGEMLGYSTEALQAKGFHEIFRAMTADESAVAVLRAHADLIVELAHRDGSTVRANMSRSAALRDEDQFALAVFQDLTERLWVDEL